jgi:hypothetical protein
VPKGAPLLAEPEIAVEHNPIRTVISPLQQVLVVVRELVMLFHVQNLIRSLPVEPGCSPLGERLFPGEVLEKA